MLLVTVGAKAQVRAVIPPNPTSADIIMLDVAKPLARLVLQPIVVNGSQIEITFRGGGILPFGGSERVTLGTLPPGVYSVVVIFVFTDEGDVPFHTLTLPPFTLSVAQGYFIPTFDYRGLVFLMIALAVTGATIVRRIH